MQRCKTCKHWGSRNTAFHDEGTRLKSCNAAAIKYGYLHDMDDVPDNGAAVEEDEGWGMQTGPDFGCVLHEPKA